jgi:hypothetical protein
MIKLFKHILWKLKLVDLVWLEDGKGDMLRVVRVDCEKGYKLVKFKGRMQIIDASNAFGGYTREYTGFDSWFRYRMYKGSKHSRAAMVSRQFREENEMLFKESEGSPIYTSIASLSHKHNLVGQVVGGIGNNNVI